ncbi:hypothetical protein [Streptomyces coeruleorubidus]|uniref:hypothetical protein n=1 Tax=Streptomyces coeruleorubidus TaxID=116188 RepID=UPI003F53CB54
MIDAREAVRGCLAPAVDADGARGAQRHEQEPVDALARAQAPLGEAAGDVQPLRQQVGQGASTSKSLSAGTGR